MCLFGGCLLPSFLKLNGAHGAHGVIVRRVVRTGNVRLMASSDSIQLVAADEIHSMSTGDVMVNATGNLVSGIPGNSTP